METAPSSEVVEKIRKLMAKGNSAGISEAEAALFLEKAHALLAEHNLTSSDLENPAEKREHGEHADRYTEPWVRRVWQGVAHLNFCGYYYQKYPNVTKVGHVVIGRKSNVVVTQDMTIYLVTTIFKLSRKAHPGTHSRQQSDFQKGCADRIVERLREMHAKVTAPEQTGTALVLSDFYTAEKARNANYVAVVLKIQLTTGKSREKRYGSEAYGAGRAAGNSVSLHRQVGGNGPKLIGGN